MPAIEIRTGPQGSPNEGAFEDGQALTVIGRKLELGEKMPTMVLWQPDRYNAIPSLEVAKLPEAYILYTVNGFLTPVCEAEAKQCQTLVNEDGLPEGVTLYGATPENLHDIRDWMIGNELAPRGNARHRIVSTFDSDAGIKLGLYIPEYDGALQRALFGVVEGRLVHAEYVYDQGGPLPDFQKAISEVSRVKRVP